MSCVSGVLRVNADLPVCVRLTGTGLAYPTVSRKLNFNNISVYLLASLIKMKWSVWTGTGSRDYCLDCEYVDRGACFLITETEKGLYN